jgi:redox-sensitive bicupin YhaK (pirin superfamily)
MGFGTHPHDNMEIITIPLEGDLAHKDSMGNEIIRNGDVQVMSAGTEKHTGIQSTKTNELNCCKFGFSKPKCRTALPTNYTRSRRTK